jgi:hypothetical protein
MFRDRGRQRVPEVPCRAQQLLQASDALSLRSRRRNCRSALHPSKPTRS